MSEYPEHDRMEAVRDRSLVIGEFLEGLRDQGLVFATWVCSFEPYPAGGMYESRPPTDEEVEEQLRRHVASRHEGGLPDGGCQNARLVPAGRTIDQMLAAYFGIDLALIEREKRAMLANIRVAR